MEKKLTKSLFDNETIDNVEGIAEREGFISNFVDEKIDDGIDDEDDGNEYVMMRSYTFTQKDNSSNRYYVRFFYGDVDNIITYVEIYEQ